MELPGGRVVILKVRMSNGTGDMPALNPLRGMKHHGSYFACPRCHSTKLIFIALHVLTFST